MCSIATFAEAKLVLICKKQYTDMLKPEGFLIPETYQKWYNTDPLHKLFVGEILAAYERTDACADLDEGDSVCSKLGRNGVFCSVVRTQ